MRRINIASKTKVIESSEQYKIVILGAGNVSFHVSRHLYLAGHQVSCVWSRSIENARQVAAASGSVAVSNPEEVPNDADFYLMAVSDRAIAEVASRFSGRKGIWMHTAGAVSMDQLAGDFENFGVLYPLQTLSSERQLSLDDAPFLVEGSSPEVGAKIHKLASSISERVLVMNSSDRLTMHLAAVFANNFSNHMVGIAEQLVEEKGGDISLLEPLIRETFLKIAESGPSSAQTGPAVRGDRETMNKHLLLLKGHPEWEKMYTFISRDIERSGKSTIDPKIGDDQL